MLRRFFPEEKDERLEEQIAAVYTEMNVVGVDSEEYPTMLKHLERLYELKASKKRREPVSRDMMLSVGGNLLGLLLILGYEQRHVITSSRGFTQLGRPKTP